MARANTITWLPLDRWAELVGIHPFHFNGLYSDTYLSSISCGTPWFQYAWQNADRLSREDIAYAIRQAERMIANEVNYNLLPDWTSREDLRYERPGIPGIYNVTGRTPRWQLASLTTRWGYIISGGVREKTGIETVAVVRSDEDGDGYDETVTINVGTSVEDADELKLYFSGRSGDDRYEIRPIEVDLDTDLDTATITCKSWQIIDPDKQESMYVGESDQSLDAEDDTNYVTTLDVYRVYNDPQTQVSFKWENDPVLCCGTCIACQLNTQNGCFHTRDPRLGIVVPSPGTWDSDDQQFTAQSWSVCRQPDRASVYYYSGWRDFSLARPKSCMDPYWEKAVAYFAAGLLDKGGCDCSNAMDFIAKWQDDRAKSVEERQWILSPGQINNRLGTTNGAIYAWNCINQEGRKIGR